MAFIKADMTRASTVVLLPILQHANHISSDDHHQVRGTLDGHLRR